MVAQALLTQGEEVGDARDLNGDGVHIDAANAVAAEGKRVTAGHGCSVSGREKPADGVGKEGAGAAGGGQDALVEGAVGGVLAPAGGKPVGGVVLAKIVALLRVDEGLVEALEDVSLDVAEAKAGRLGCDAPDQFGAVAGRGQPAAEIGF